MVPRLEVTVRYSICVFVVYLILFLLKAEACFVCG